MSIDFCQQQSNNQHQQSNSIVSEISSSFVDLHLNLHNNPYHRHNHHNRRSVPETSIPIESLPSSSQQQQQQSAKMSQKQPQMSSSASYSNDSQSSSQNHHSHSDRFESSSSILMMETAAAAAAQSSSSSPTTTTTNFPNEIMFSRDSDTPPVIRWSHSFRNIIDDVNGVKLFSQYLAESNLLDMLTFWFACQGMKKLPTEMVVRAAKAILRKFVLKPSQVHLSDSLRQDLKKLHYILNSNQTAGCDEGIDILSKPNSLDEAHQVVERSLSGAIYDNFLKSDIFIQYYSSVVYSQNNNDNNNNNLQTQSSSLNEGDEDQSESNDQILHQHQNNVIDDYHYNEGYSPKNYSEYLPTLNEEEFDEEEEEEVAAVEAAFHQEASKQLVVVKENDNNENESNNDDDNSFDSTAANYNANIADSSRDDLSYHQNNNLEPESLTLTQTQNVNDNNDIQEEDKNPIDVNEKFSKISLGQQPQQPQSQQPQPPPRASSSSLKTENTLMTSGNEHRMLQQQQQTNNKHNNNKCTNPSNVPVLVPPQSLPPKQQSSQKPPPSSLSLGHHPTTTQQQLSQQSLHNSHQPSLFNPSSSLSSSANHQNSITSGTVSTAPSAFVLPGNSSSNHHLSSLSNTTAVKAAAAIGGFIGTKSYPNSGLSSNNMMNNNTNINKKLYAPSHNPIMAKSYFNSKQYENPPHPYHVMYNTVQPNSTRDSEIQSISSHSTGDSFSRINRGGGHGGDKFVSKKGGSGGSGGHSHGHSSHGTNHNLRQQQQFNRTLNLNPLFGGGQGVSSSSSNQPRNQPSSSSRQSAIDPSSNCEAFARVLIERLEKVRSDQEADNKLQNLLSSACGRESPAMNATGLREAGVGQQSDQHNSSKLCSGVAQSSTSSSSSHQMTSNQAVKPSSLKEALKKHADFSFISENDQAILDKHCAQVFKTPNSGTPTGASVSATGVPLAPVGGGVPAGYILDSNHNQSIRFYCSNDLVNNNPNHNHNSHNHNLVTAKVKFSNEDCPFKITMTGPIITLSSFKQLIPQHLKRPNQKYYFMRKCTEMELFENEFGKEFDHPYIKEEITDDNEILPQYDGKMCAVIV